MKTNIFFLSQIYGLLCFFVISLTLQNEAVKQGFNVYKIYEGMPGSVWGWIEEPTANISGQQNFFELFEKSFSMLHESKKKFRKTVPT